MKKGIVLTLLATAVAIFGCAGDGGSPDEPTYRVETEEDPGSIDPNCCGVTHGTVISGTAPSGGQYYVLALIYEDTIVTHGQPVFIPEGPYENVELKVSVSYLDELPTGQSRMEVLAYENVDYPLLLRDRSLAQAASEYVEVASYADSICVACCTHELQRYKAIATKLVGTDGAIGAEAMIESRYGRLCGEGTTTADTAPAQQGCFAGLCEHFDASLGRPHQAQTGWIVRRKNGVVLKGVYVEISMSRDSTTTAILTDLVPADGSQHEYTIIREEARKFLFLYDGDTLYSVATMESWGWQDIVLPYVTWQGEISGRETDMPGTSSSPCYFSICRYNAGDGDGWRSATFHNASSADTLWVTRQSGNREDEWGIDFSEGAGSFWIWDKHPYEE